MKFLKCLSLLLLPTKVKSADREIPFLLKFVPVSACIVNCS